MNETRIWGNRGTLRGSDSDLVKAPLPDSTQRLYRSDDHVGNFFDCVRSRKQPICDVVTGHQSAMISQVGVIAFRTGLKLSWDPKRETFTGSAAREGNRHLAREMRKPYDYSFVGG